jgi:uncharacterized protein (DUF1697 family)
MDTYLSYSGDLVSEAERRVDRGRQIVARQRELVAKLGEQFPIAVTLLKSFERSLALFEEVLATHQRNEVSIARAEQALVVPTTPNCLEEVDATGAKLDHQERMRAVARILEILREGGYHCELDQKTLH